MKNNAMKTALGMSDKDNPAAEKKQKFGPLAGLRQRTVTSLLGAWRGIKGTARMVIAAEVRPDVPQEDVPHLRKRMRECLHSRGGEITARAHTVELGRTYLRLSEQGRARFLHVLAEEFHLDGAVLERAMESYRKASGAEAKIAGEAALREALCTPRSTILRRFSALPDGFKFLVDMRADLLPLLAKNPALAPLEHDMKQILSSWFDVGLLDLVEINWNSPAALLEKLIAYEAVHPIHSWEDLKNRTDADRRIYAFLHAKMPLEPLIFVQVALVEGMADNIQALLDEHGPVTPQDAADTAIFYSISNAQKGLVGISFGNFLIKRVVDRLSHEIPTLKHFATLSPIPGFRAWLDVQLKQQGAPLFGAAELEAIMHHSGAKEPDAGAAMIALLDGEWFRNPECAEALKPVLMRSCAQYLLHAKKTGKSTTPPAPLDPVSQFHLFNGARIERINWLADVSAKGMRQSAGMMVNYYYKLSEIDGNHEEYVTEGSVIATRGVKALLKGLK